jgi:hypothetical protein
LPPFCARFCASLLFDQTPRCCLKQLETIEEKHGDAVQTKRKLLLVREVSAQRNDPPLQYGQEKETTELTRRSLAETSRLPVPAQGAVVRDLVFLDLRYQGASRKIQRPRRQALIAFDTTKNPVDDEFLDTRNYNLEIVDGHE